MKRIKTFQELNESSDNLNKSFRENLKIIDQISLSIINDKDLKDNIKLIQNASPETANAIKKYFDIGLTSQKLVKSLKQKSLSLDKTLAIKQLNSVIKLADSLKDGYNHIIDFEKNTKTGFEQKEGIGNIIGNTLKNILTGKWIVNIIKNIKSNITGSYNEINTVGDLFDVKDY